MHIGIRHIPGGYLIAALLLFRVAFLMLGDAFINGDGIIYVNASQQIAETGKLPPARFQSLGFAVEILPVILVLDEAGFAQHYPTTRVTTNGVAATTFHAINVAMDLVIVLVLLHEAARLLTGRIPSWAVASAFVFLALQPFTTSQSNFIYPDHACMFFSFLGGYCVYLGISGRGHGGWIAAGSLLLGLAGLARFDMIPVCAAMLLAAYAVLIWQVAQGFRLHAVALSSVLFAAPLFGMCIFQYASTGEIGYLRTATTQNANTLRGGYLAWLRTWLVLAQDHSILAASETAADWPGFSIDTYPTRAFTNSSERAAIAATLDDWKLHGYSPEIDAQFLGFADSNRTTRPVETYLLVPLMRVQEYWLNIEGSRAINESLHGMFPANAIAWLRRLTVALAALGFGVSWIGQWKIAPDDASSYGLARFLSLMVLLRTGELIVLGMALAGGLMESRYVTVAMPAMLLLAIVGWKQLCEMLDQHRSVRLAKAS